MADDMQKNFVWERVQVDFVVRHVRAVVTVELEGAHQVGGELRERRERHGGS